MKITTVNKICEHMKEIMKELDIPITPSNEQTPYRVAKMWENELFKNRNNRNIEALKSKMTVFPNEYGNNMVIVKDIHFHSICEHHWLPFSGKVTVGYVPKGVVIGLSKIPRVVKFFSQKPQLQEQLTKEIGDFLWEVLDSPYALFVEIEAEHQCVMCRGAESPCSTNTFYSNSYIISSSKIEEYRKEFNNRK